MINFRFSIILNRGITKGEFLKQKWFKAKILEVQTFI